MHLLCLLGHCLPNKLALKPLLVVLRPPLFRKHAIPMSLFSLPSLQISLELAESIIRLLLLQQFKQLLVCLELHVRYVLVLEARLEIVFSLSRSLYELLLSYPSLFLLHVLLPV